MRNDRIKHCPKNVLVSFCFYPIKARFNLRSEIVEAPCKIEKGVKDCQQLNYPYKVPAQFYFSENDQHHPGK